MMGCLLKLQEDNIIIAIPALVKYKNGQKRATRRACPDVQMMYFMQKENAMLSTEAQINRYFTTKGCPLSVFLNT